METKEYEALLRSQKLYAARRSIPMDEAADERVLQILVAQAIWRHRAEQVFYVAWLLAAYPVGRFVLAPLLGLP